jgi:hypothetical protein
MGNTLVNVKEMLKVRKDLVISDFLLTFASEIKG